MVLIAVTCPYCQSDRIAKDVELLGFQILAGRIQISTKARKRLKDQVRRLTPRNNGQSMSYGKNVRTYRFAGGYEPACKFTDS